MFRHGLNACRNIVTCSRGSISVLTIGLFSVLLLTTLVLTDISTVYLAKRTLILASEAAMQRGMKNLDKNSYYSGEYNINRAVITALGGGEEDPGIPIDCSAGLGDARELLSTWQGRDRKVSRSRVSGFAMTNFECDGFRIYLESTAVVEIPFPIPFIGLSEVRIYGSAGAVGERSETNNYSGFDIG